jgi:glycogen/starch/alpha-glucan phosphorylase-like protein
MSTGLRNFTRRSSKTTAQGLVCNLPERFQNKTNGITQRRWLGLCNPELCDFLDARIGKGYLGDLERISALREHLSDDDVVVFNEIKRMKKQQLSKLIEAREGVVLPPDFIFDVQVKRMHEYKRQLLNAFGILDTYFGLKDGRITEFTPTAYIFGAKAAPGYIRAKAIIKYINELAKLINNDPAVNDKMRVVFVQNYNCSYAEHIIPAADVSEQISPAGTEASGTGNMKLMLNGAVTLGTYDGANVEIVEQAGAEKTISSRKRAGAQRTSLALCSQDDLRLRAARAQGCGFPDRRHAQRRQQRRVCGLASCGADRQRLAEGGLLLRALRNAQLLRTQDGTQLRVP